MCETTSSGYELPVDRSRYRTAEEARLEATAHEAVGGDDQQELRLHPRQDAECGQDDR